jgi:hypothetical protein
LTGGCPRNCWDGLGKQARHIIDIDGAGVRGDGAQANRGGRGDAEQEKWSLYVHVIIITRRRGDKNVVW